MLLDLHTDFSGGKLGGLVFPSLEEFSTVCCDPHSQRFDIVNKAEVDVFLELSCFFSDPADVDNLISNSYDFSKSSLNIWMFMVQVQKLHLEVSPMNNAIGDSFPIDLNSKRIIGRQLKEEAWP